MSCGPRRPLVHAVRISVSFADPVRHGTHLPQDSLRKNRTEFNAMSSMHARSSQTMMAPDPTVAPAWDIAFQSSGRSSIDLLRRAIALLSTRGLAVANVDVTVILEKPKH